MSPWVLSGAGAAAWAVAMPSALLETPTAAAAVVAVASWLEAARRSRAAGLAGLVGGHLAVLAWVPGPVSGRAGYALGIGSWLFLACYSAAWSAAALAAIRLRSAWVAVPLAWWFTEAARARLFGGFDWLALGHAAVDAAWAQHLYPMVGVHGVSAALVTAALLVRRWPLPAGVVVVAVCAAPCTCPAPAVGDLVVALSDGPPRGDPRADLLLAPEGSLGGGEAPVTGAEVLAGGRERCGSVGTRRCEQNVVVHLGAAGERLAVYAKRRLVPLWEADFLGLRASDARQMRAGGEPGLVTVAGHRVGLALCYDIVDATVVAELASAGAELVVHLTSDRWQHGPAAARQHLAIARARAATVRLPLIRVSDGPLDAVVDAHGRWSSAPQVLRPPARAVHTSRDSRS